MYGIIEAKDKVIQWLHDSGILADNNQIYGGVKFYQGNWVLDTGKRIDAQVEVAMAFLYHYLLTKDTWYKTKASALLYQARIDSDIRNGNKPWQCSWYANDACYTQDNGRQMRGFALGSEILNDPNITAILVELTDFWVSVTPEDGGVGVGINCIHAGNWLQPPQYPCARHIGELLTGMIRAYDAYGKVDYYNASVRMGEWLYNRQQVDGRFLCPTTSDMYNCGEGLQMEATSLSLRGIAELYRITGIAKYKTSAEKAYNWIKGQCEEAMTNWGLGRVPSELHFASDLRFFNTLYMQTPMSLIKYYQACGQDITALDLTNEILSFMANVMMMHNGSLIEGGIVGEWDLSTNARSTRVDLEVMKWGDWIFTGWCNCEFIEACVELCLLGYPPPPPQPILRTATSSGKAWGFRRWSVPESKWG